MLRTTTRICEARHGTQWLLWRSLKRQLEPLSLSFLRIKAQKGAIAAVSNLCMLFLCWRNCVLGKKKKKKKLISVGFLDMQVEISESTVKEMGRKLSRSGGKWKKYREIGCETKVGIKGHFMGLSTAAVRQKRGEEFPSISIGLYHRSRWTSREAWDIGRISFSKIVWIRSIESPWSPYASCIRRSWYTRESITKLRITMPTHKMRKKTRKAKKNATVRTYTGLGRISNLKPPTLSVYL